MYNAWPYREDSIQTITPDVAGAELGHTVVQEPAKGDG